MLRIDYCLRPYLPTDSYATPLDGCWGNQFWDDCLCHTTRSTSPRSCTLWLHAATRIPVLPFLRRTPAPPHTAPTHPTLPLPLPACLLPACRQHSPRRWDLGRLVVDAPYSSRVFLYSHCTRLLDAVPATTHAPAIPPINWRYTARRRTRCTRRHACHFTALHLPSTRILRTRICLYHACHAKA